MKDNKYNNFPQVLDQYMTRYFELHDMNNLPESLYEKMVSMLESNLFDKVLKLTRGNQIRAAKILGINRNTLRTRLAKLNIDPRSKKHKG